MGGVDILDGCIRLDVRQRKIPLRNDDRVDRVRRPRRRVRRRELVEEVQERRNPAGAGLLEEMLLRVERVTWLPLAVPQPLVLNAARDMWRGRRAEVGDDELQGLPRRREVRGDRRRLEELLLKVRAVHFRRNLVRDDVLRVVVEFLEDAALVEEILVRLKIERRRRDDEIELLVPVLLLGRKDPRRLR